MNFTDSSVRERARQLERFVDDHRRRRRRDRAATRRPPSAGSADRGPPSAPGRQRSAVSAISGSIASSRSTVSRASAVAKSRRSSAGGSAFGHCRSKNVAARLARCRACRSPTDRGSAAPPRGPDGEDPSAPVPSPRSSASPAASAARQPPPSRSPRPPLRAPCCRCPRRRAPAPPRPSSSSARRTTSARRSRPPPSVSPCATADEMYSKCGVSPRIRQPRQTIASNRPLSAACCAASGISKAPGTRTTVTSRRRDAGRGQRRQRAGLQPVGDEVVVLRHDDREPESGRAS